MLRYSRGDQKLILLLWASYEWNTFTCQEKYNSTDELKFKKDGQLTASRANAEKFYSLDDMVVKK